MTDLSALVAAVLNGDERSQDLPTSEEAHRSFHHDDWDALLRRFVHNGEVDYSNFRRVRRILEAYLDRLAHARPELWLDRRDRLAFYINAYNAIVIHHILGTGDVETIRDIPGIWTKPYPIGRRNVSLLTLEHNFIRSFGDPRIHTALVCGARGCPILQPFAYTADALDTQLELTTTTFLADEERGMRYDTVFDTLYLSRIFHWYAGDWALPTAMPSPFHLTRGLIQPQIALDGLMHWMPAPVQQRLHSRPGPRLEWFEYDWSLNQLSSQQRAHALGDDNSGRKP